MKRCGSGGSRRQPPRTRGSMLDEQELREPARNACAGVAYGGPAPSDWPGPTSASCGWQSGWSRNRVREPGILRSRC
jgi:hypothetical protein